MQGFALDHMEWHNSPLCAMIAQQALANATPGPIPMDPFMYSPQPGDYPTLEWAVI